MCVHMCMCVHVCTHVCGGKNFLIEVLEKNKFHKLSVRERFSNRIDCNKPHRFTKNPLLVELLSDEKD